MKQLVQSSWNLTRIWGKTPKRTNSLGTLRICMGDIFCYKPTSSLYSFIMKKNQYFWSSNNKSIEKFSLLAVSSPQNRSHIQQRVSTMFGLIMSSLKWRDVNYLCFICLYFLHNYLYNYLLNLPILLIYCKLKLFSRCHNSIIICSMGNIANMIALQ